MSKRYYTCHVCGNDAVIDTSSMDGWILLEETRTCSSCGYSFEYSYGMIYETFTKMTPPGVRYLLKYERVKLRRKRKHTAILKQ